MSEAVGGPDLIVIIPSIIAIGVIAQVLADRFRVPSVVFLIGAGVVLGPEVTGLLDPTNFLDGLTQIVGLSVGIIVFEGAFHIQLDELREAPSEALRLVTVGAVISLLGTAVAVRFLLGAAWATALLIGALLVATGPTVINPILQVVPVRDRVATALETEGIINDVTAAILAAVIFKSITAEGNGPGQLVRLFVSKLGTGILVGLIVAGVLWYLLKHVDLSPDNAPRNARLLVLAGALVAYAAAEPLEPEAGIAAVATAGVVLGNTDVPYREEISEFKGDVTLVVLSVVFITLAALLDFGTLLELGLRGVGVVLVVALLVRPLLVLLSTTGGRFTQAERAFVSLVGPRGIIPASVATLFAIQLRSPAVGMADAADLLVGTVFLVILVTVVFEAGFARRIARKLNVIPMRVIIVGGGRVGRELAERLQERGENVVIVETDQDTIQVARNAGFTVRRGDGTDIEELREAGADNAKIVVAATGNDDANLLVAQLSRSTFDTENVMARVNNPDNVEAFEELGVRAISASQATAWAIDNAIERPALSTWMTELGRSGDVQEVEVTSESLTGRTIADVDEEIPNGCLIGMVSRNGDNQVPDGDFTIQQGDHLTFIGRTEAVREAIEWCHPGE
jgi:NhaP-type Na+/H+ or K+/H+ antiporter